MAPFIDENTRIECHPFTQKLKAFIALSVPATYYLLNIGKPQHTILERETSRPSDEYRTQ